MLPEGNNGRCLIASLSATVIAAAVSVFITPSLGAMTDIAGIPADNLIGGTAAQIDTKDVSMSLPDTGGVVNAYLVLRTWVRTFDPPSNSEPEAALQIEGATGVSVILRRQGRVLGMGHDITGDDLMLRRAAGRALLGVLGDPTVSNLPESRRTEIGGSLTIELEVAGGLIPLPGRSFAQIAEQIEPGLDGIAMRRGETIRAMFPSTMLATNTAKRIERMLPSLAVDLGLPARTLSELRSKFGVQVYRFRTMHLTQRAPGRSPFETFRGQRIVSESEVTTERIQAFAEGLCDHLITSLWGGDEPLGVMGDYSIVADKYTPMFAPPREQGLIAFALARYSSCPQLHKGEAERARDTAQVILEDLANSVEGETDPLTDPLACAAIAYAGSALTEGSHDESSKIQHLLGEARRRVAATFNLGTGFATPDARPAEEAGAAAGTPQPPSPSGQAILAGAMARLLTMDPSSIEHSKVRAAIDAAWASVPEHQQITLLPWIGWAELDLALATNRPLANSHRLLAIRQLLDLSRIGSAASIPGANPGARAGAEDLAGGFALSGRGLKQADAQTTRPAAFLATMLRDSRLTDPAGAPAALARHLRTMRFLIQLSVNDSALWSVRNPNRAKGGIRTATWDSHQPAAAQAMALLAAAETLLSEDALDLKAGGNEPARRAESMAIDCNPTPKNRLQPHRRRSASGLAGPFARYSHTRGPECREPAHR